MKTRKKNRKVRRLTNNEVSTVAEMQWTIDAYENYIYVLYALVVKNDSNVKCLSHDVPLSSLMNEIWKRIYETKVVKKLKSND